MDDIQKYIPRKPQRLNEIQQRFVVQERNNAKDKKSTVNPYKRKVGPIDLSSMDTRTQLKAVQPSARGAQTENNVNEKANTGILGKLKQASESHQHILGKNRMPIYSEAEDKELGIDRNLVDPVKFISAIDSKPIYPPYLQLADFEDYLKNEASKVANGADKKKPDPNAQSGDKGKDGAAGKGDVDG